MGLSGSATGSGATSSTVSGVASFTDSLGSSIAGETSFLGAGEASFLGAGESSFLTDPSATAATLAANSAATPLADLAGFSGSGAGVELADGCSGVEAGGTTWGDLEVPSTDTSCLVVGSMIAILFLVRFRVFCVEGGCEGIF